MTYLFNSNTSATISNEVEIKNDAGNAVPVNATIFNNNSAVTIANPFPVTLGSNTITIYGNTNIVDSVTVQSTPENPVHVHLTEIGSANIMTMDFLPVKGNVNVINNVNVTVLNPSSGNVNIISMPNVTVSNPFNGNVTVMNPVSNVNIISMPAITILNDANNIPKMMFADTVQLDSTERLRVAQLGQQWWYTPTIDKDTDLRISEKVQGNLASSTFIQNLASIRMTSGNYYSANTQLSGFVARASRRRHKTRPGVTQEWMGIVNWDGLQANVVKRIGLFTNYNGVFFEANSTSVSAVVRRRLTDGVMIESRIPYTEWSNDKMDGTGPSTYNWTNGTIIANVTSVLNVSNIYVAGDGYAYRVTYQLPAGEETKLKIGNKVTLTGLTPITFNDTGLVSGIDTVNHRANIAYISDPGTYVSASNAKMTNSRFHQMHSYWFDFSGSRVARIRFGLHTDAGKVCVHEYAAGEIGSQWVSAPALMDRKEILNVGEVNFLPSLTVAGSAVSTETVSEVNPGFGVAQCNVSVLFNKTTDENKEYAILGVGMRIGEPYQRADLRIDSIQFVDIGNLNPQNSGIFQWRLVLNPTLSLPATITNIGKATRMLDYPSGTTITGGLDLIGGYSQGTYTNDVRTALNFVNIGSNIDYTDSDIMVLVVKLIKGGSADSIILGTMGFTEDL